MEAIKVEDVVAVKLVDNVKVIFSRHQEYKPPIKMFGITFKKEVSPHFYNIGFRGHKSTIKNLKNFIVLDNQLYYKPYLLFHLKGGHSYSKEFNSKKEAIDFFNLYFSENIFLKL